MTRILAVVLSCLFLLSGLALAVKCPPPEKQCVDIPDSCASDVSCSVDVEWFAKYEGCTDGDKAVFVMQNFALVLFSSKRQFKVKNFKKGTDDCDFDGAPQVTDFAEPGSTAVNFLPVHVLTARKTGCYHVNLILEDGCPVDPHIIVRQYRPNALGPLLPKK